MVRLPSTLCLPSPGAHVSFSFDNTFNRYVLFVLHIYGPFMPANGNPFAKLGVKGQEQLKAPKPCNVRVVNGNISFIPGECGEPAIENNIFFWGFLFTDLIVNVLMTWCGVPLWSIFCRPFTHGLPRFAQCGCNFEPFTSMDDGLPCFRPRKQQWEVLMEDTNARLKSMERLLSAEAHIRRSMRNRFKARLQNLRV